MNQANETQQVATLVFACAFTLGVRVIKIALCVLMVEKIVALTSRKEFRLKLDMLPSKLRRYQTASSKVGR